MILHFTLQLFHFETLPVRWENLDRGQYPFQPIKFVNLVVPSPCETEPHNNKEYFSCSIGLARGCAGDGGQ